jgi:hypothetical protein
MARHARVLGLGELAVELEAMADVELRHETFFFDALARRRPFGAIFRLIPRAASPAIRDQ